MSDKEVIIVGGGIAGLTTAYQLLKQPNTRFRVTVLEAEPVPGGQARAFTVDGETVEHGSHAFFGYYVTVLAMIDELRADPTLAPGMPALERIPGWTLVDPYARRAMLTHSKWLPRILSVMPSILRVPWFSFCDKVRALWAALRLVLTPFARYKELDQYTSYQYGRKVGYSDTGIWTWNSASLGLTNLFVQEQSGAILAGKHRVLIGTVAGLTYQLPAGNLSKLFAEPMRKKVESLGGTVTVGARALGVERAAGAQRTRVRFQSKTGVEEREADHVIVALQPWDAKALLPWVSARWTELSPVTPVITMVLQLSGKIAESADGRELGCSREHWAFSVVTDLSAFWPEFKGDKTVLRVEIGHANLMPSGVDIDEAVLTALVKTDLQRLFPETAAMTIEWTRLHRESKQVYVRWTRGQWSKKPEQAERDVGQGVFLAGDWTSKGTIGMEAAANSGIEAANWILAAEKLPVIEYTNVPLD